MCYNHSLQELKLDHNKLRVKGESECHTSSLATFMEVNHTLKFLSMAECNLGDQGMQILCHGLTFNSVISVINLTGNFLENKSLILMAKVLKKGIAKMTKLNFSNNLISDEGAMALAHAMRYT